MGWALSEPIQAAPYFPLVGLLWSLFTRCSLDVPHWGGSTSLLSSVPSAQAPKLFATWSVSVSQTQSS